MNEVSVIRDALSASLRRAQNRLDASYGRSIDARDQEWHDIRYAVEQQHKALAALDELSARLSRIGSSAPPAAQDHDGDCTCHILGETCSTCNERYRDATASEGGQHDR